MAKTGWLKLHRPIIYNTLYQESRKFSKLEAWMDILLNTNYEEETKRLYGAAIIIPIGSFATSYSQLAKSWQWDKKAVIKFIDYLVNENMITVAGTKIDPKSGTKTGTIINVTNWAFYQGAGTKTGTKSGTKVDPKKQDSFLLYKEEKNIYSILFSFWNEQGIIKHQELTPETKKAIDATLKEIPLEQIKICMTRYKTILNDDSYFFSYRWSLVDFLKRKAGIKDFLDDGAKWVSYQTAKKAKPEPTKPQKQETIWLDPDELANRWKE